MAGQGIRTWVPGEVITADNIQGYLQDQAVQVYANSAARSSAVTGIVAEGMVSVLKDTDVAEYYNGSGWVSLQPSLFIAGTAGQVFTSNGTAGAQWASTLSGVTLTSPNETTTVTATAATGTVSYDALTQADLYYTTNASANFTIDFRGDSGTTLNSILPVGQTKTLIFRNTNGSTAYRPTVFKIDGTTVTPKWQGGNAPSAGNASAVDVYSFAITKTASTPTYQVFASQSKFA